VHLNNSYLDNSYLFSDVQTENIGNPKFYDYKDPYKTKTECCEIEPNPSKDRAVHQGDNLSI
jgi:hypothetical protein